MSGGNSGKSPAAGDKPAPPPPAPSQVKPPPMQVLRKSEERQGTALLHGSAMWAH